MFFSNQIESVKNDLAQLTDIEKCEFYNLALIDEFKSLILNDKLDDETRTLLLEKMPTAVKREYIQLLKEKQAGKFRVTTAI